uniref:Uncharacterized protein n=1 Tax=Lepeophtheirus salmonis TaxID=72036 RepID=A0A0K2UY44_LEPSM
MKETQLQLQFIWLQFHYFRTLIIQFSNFIISF